MSYLTQRSKLISPISLLRFSGDLNQLQDLKFESLKAVILENILTGGMGIFFEYPKIISYSSSTTDLTTRIDLNYKLF